MENAATDGTFPYRDTVNWGGKPVTEEKRDSLNCAVFPMNLTLALMKPQSRGWAATFALSYDGERLLL